MSDVHLWGGACGPSCVQVQSHTEGAVKELRKASDYQKAYRKKMCILLLIVLCIALGMVLWLGKDSKKG